MSDLVIITDDNFADHINPIVDGQRRLCTAIPRDWDKDPHGSLMFAKPFDLPLIPESEWPDRLAAQKAAKSQLSDIRNRGMDGKPIPSRDQNGKGYCWAHSSVSAMMLERAAKNQPYADLSAYAVACIIKNYRDQGGWGGESLKFIGERGVPTSKYWPQQSMDRKNDNPETWGNAALHKAIEWMDLDPQAVKAQLVTCLLLTMPVVADYPWWSHSVCAMNLESIDPFQIRIWNSWGDNWSENGTGILQGRRAIPDGALGLRVSTASAA